MATLIIRPRGREGVWGCVDPTLHMFLAARCLFIFWLLMFPWAPGSSLLSLIMEEEAESSGLGEHSHLETVVTVL